MLDARDPRLADTEHTAELRLAEATRLAQRTQVAGQGQALLPMLELLENAQASIDELMNEAARAFIEQLLVVSAQEVAGTKLRGRTDFLSRRCIRRTLPIISMVITPCIPRCTKKAAG